MLKSFAGLVTALTVLSGASQAADDAPNWTKPPEATAKPAPQATIHFARHGGIQDWAVTDEKTIYVQGRDRQWYKGDLMGPCIGLNFALRLGFTFEPNGDFDKFSSVRYEHRNCPLVSLTAVDPPPGHKGKVANPGATKSSSERPAAPGQNLAAAKD